jgi:hypothetical protein
MQLFCFPVQGMRFAERAILFELQLFFGLVFVLHCIVIFLLAFRACHRYLDAHVNTSMSTVFVLFTLKKGFRPCKIIIASYLAIATIIFCF